MANSFIKWSTVSFLYLPYTWLTLLEHLNNHQSLFCGSGFSQKISEDTCCTLGRHATSVLFNGSSARWCRSQQSDVLEKVYTKNLIGATMKNVSLYKRMSPAAAPTLMSVLISALRLSKCQFVSVILFSFTQKSNLRWKKVLYIQNLKTHIFYCCCFV